MDKETKAVKFVKRNQSNEKPTAENHVETVEGTAHEPTIEELKKENQELRDGFAKLYQQATMLTDDLKHQSTKLRLDGLFKVLESDKFPDYERNKARQIIEDFLFPREQEQEQALGSQKKE